MEYHEHEHDSEIKKFKYLEKQEEEEIEDNKKDYDRTILTRKGELYDSYNVSTMRGTLESIDKKDKDIFFNEEIRGSGSMAFKKKADEGFLNLDYINNNNYYTEELFQIQEEAEFSNIRELKGVNYKYYGEVEFSERIGFGTCEYTDGSRYVGQWKQNKHSGVGKLYSPIGELYEGDFKNNKPDGYICYTTIDNVKYEGFMKNFIYLAHTVIIVTTRTQVIELVLEKDFDTRENANTNCNTSNTISKCFEGIGVIMSSDKSYYEGFVKDSNQDNYGILKKDNMIFKGIKQNKQYNGYCEISYRDGTRYFGYLRNNKKNGLGIFLSKDFLLNVACYTENCKDGASITRKYDSAINNEIFVYENFHQGFRSNKLEGREVIEKYIQNFYPEQMPLFKIDFNSLICILED